MKDGKPVVLFVHSGGFWKSDCFLLARQLGYYTICAEAEGIDLRDLNRLADHAFAVRLYDNDADRFLGDVIGGLSAHGIDRPEGVVTFFELAVEQTANIGAHYGLTAIQGATAHRARNKFDMRMAIGDPFFTDGFERVITEDEVCRFFERQGGRPIVLKPCDLAASTGVMRIVDAKEIVQAWAEANDALRKFVELYGYNTTNGLMVERMMPMGSLEYNVDLFVNNGRPYVIGIAQKQGLYDGPSFREDAYVFPPNTLTVSERRELEIESRRAVSAVGVTSGAIHLEAKMITDGCGGRRPCVIELAARCAGDLEMPALKRHRGGVTDLRELVLKQSVDRLHASDLEAARACDDGSAPMLPVAVCVKYADRVGTLLADIGIPQYVADSFHVVESRFEAQKGHHIILPENDYLGAVICEGRSPVEALEHVNGAIGRIPVKIGERRLKPRSGALLAAGGGA